MPAPSAPNYGPGAPLNLRDSNYSAILQAIHDICVEVHNAKWASGPNVLKGSTLWELPTPQQIDAIGGFPIISVRFGTNAGFAAGGELVSAQAAFNQSGILEPVWDFDVYDCFIYDPDNPTHQSAGDMAFWLAQGIYNNQTLRGKASSRVAYNINPAYVELLSPDGATTLPCSAAYLTVQAYENLTINQFP